MAETETLYVSGVGSECNILNQVGAACPNHYQNVDEEVHNDAVDYVSHDREESLRDLYALDNHVLASGAINHVKVIVWAKAANTPNQESLWICLKCGATVGEAVKTVTDAWAEYTETWTEKPGGGAWSVDDLDALEAGIVLKACIFEEKEYTYCTQVYIEVNYAAVDPDIENLPTTIGFGVLTASATSTTGLDHLTVTNNSVFAVDISIKATDMTGGNAWTLSDTATPGEDIVGLKAGLSGGDYTIVVKKNAPYNDLVSGLAGETTQDWGLKIYAPTAFTDGVEKSGTITLTATAT